MIHNSIRTNQRTIPGLTKDVFRCNRNIRRVIDVLRIIFGQTRNEYHPVIEKRLREMHSSSRETIMETSKMSLMDIPNVDVMQRRHKCAAVGGEHFEGDNIDFYE